MDMITATFLAVALIAIIGAVFGLLAAIADGFLFPWLLRRRLKREYEETRWRG